MKKQVRLDALKKRNSIPLLEQIELSSKVINNLVDSSFWHNATSVMLYLSIGSEVFTLFLLSKAIEQDKELVLPKVKGKHIVPVRVGSNFKLISGFGGILEPEKGDEYVNSISLCVVPLVAFDNKGYRLGYGGGYYDRFLKKYNDKIKLKVGLAYEIQRYEDLPAEDHDMMLDAICTERGIMQVEISKYSFLE